MTSLKRTNSEDKDFQQLVTLLDADLRTRDGDEHAFYAQYNKIDMIKNAAVYYVDGMPAGCGAFKEYDKNTVEVKRMFVKPEYRGNGAGLVIVKELEAWASSLNYEKAVLETGKKQPEAIRLYQKAGYHIIPNYGQYENIENSVCMCKLLL